MSVQRRERNEAIALNLVRGLAALAVVLCHARAISFPRFGQLAPGQQTIFAKLLYALTTLGPDAVVVFFVLSGYLVFGRIVLRLGAFDPRHYTIERATRILVPLVPACGLTAAVALFTGYPLSVWGALAHMVGLNEVLIDTSPVNGALWTLPYEIWFYILGGAVAAIAAKKRPVAALSVLSIAVLVFSRLDPRFLLYWLLGGAMVLFRRERGGLALLGLPVIAFGMVLYQANADLKSGDQVAVALGQTLIAIGFAFTLPLLASEESTRHLSQVRGLARALSAISYSLYLTHFSVLTLSRLLDPPVFGSVTRETLDLAARTAVCLLVATGFWWLFERNTGAVRRLLHARRSERIPALEPAKPGNWPIRH